MEGRATGVVMVMIALVVIAIQIPILVLMGMKAIRVTTLHIAPPIFVLTISAQLAQKGPRATPTAIVPTDSFAPTTSVQQTQALVTTAVATTPADNFHYPQTV